ncbi:MAG: hypothetical protein JXB47_01405 [Anaerolineae bacterium]|nr:hypothetical protein [Anaerolineae bacterium]
MNTTESTLSDYHPGDVVCVYRWHGIVQNVYVSPINGTRVLEIAFIKNIFKAQPPELHKLTPETLIERATLDDLKAEAKALETGQQERLTAVLSQLEPLAAD